MLTGAGLAPLKKQGTAYQPSLRKGLQAPMTLSSLPHASAWNSVWLLLTLDLPRFFDIDQANTVG
jgi:hypothetical protein